MKFIDFLRMGLTITRALIEVLEEMKKKET